MATPSKYWREIPQRYRFEANICSQCGKKFFPPRLICSACGGEELERTKIAEKGSLLTFTVIRVPPHQFEDQAPYAVGVVELEDGVKLTAQIVDCPFDRIEIGMPLKLEFRKIQTDGEAGIINYGYKFVPAV